MLHCPFFFLILHNLMVSRYDDSLRSRIEQQRCTHFVGSREYLFGADAVRQNSKMKTSKLNLSDGLFWLFSIRVDMLLKILPSQVRSSYCKELRNV